MTHIGLLHASLHRVAALLLCAAMASACARKPVTAPAVQGDRAVAEQPGQPAAISPATMITSTTATQREAAVYIERRKPRPAVIGGCEERCERPEGAVELLFEKLLDERRVQGLYASFDWSLLEVDGEDLGARWSGMWGRLDRREVRRKQIDQWLRNWSAWVGEVDDRDEIVRSRITGIELRALPDRSDVVEVSYRHPKLAKPRGEAIWRLHLTRRGYEWLVSRIDHSPGNNPTKRALPAGSPSAGRL